MNTPSKKRMKASREVSEMILGPMWPGGAVGQACRPCRSYLSEMVCPECGRATVEVIVFNTPNSITEDDLTVSKAPPSLANRL